LGGRVGRGLGGFGWGGVGGGCCTVGARRAPLAQAGGAPGRKFPSFAACWLNNFPPGLRGSHLRQVGDLDARRDLVAHDAAGREAADDLRARGGGERGAAGAWGGALRRMRARSAQSSPAAPAAPEPPQTSGRTPVKRPPHLRVRRRVGVHAAERRHDAAGHADQAERVAGAGGLLLGEARDGGDAEGTAEVWGGWRGPGGGVGGGGDGNVQAASKQRATRGAPAGARAPSGGALPA
jgi:hypothetical protein